MTGQFSARSQTFGGTLDYSLHMKFSPCDTATTGGASCFRLHAPLDASGGTELDDLEVTCQNDTFVFDASLKNEMIWAVSDLPDGFW